MSLFTLSVKHGRTLEEARARLEMAVDEVRARFGSMVRQVEWAGGRDAVKILGTGFTIELRVDPQEVHASGDLHFLGALFGTTLTAGLKQVVQHTFLKRLP
ncbi:MAG TPA: polyhydroxyalkanoic acid system family protein [Isosphaeraceae bacterium]|nr:polyhydroxyalkanoic acid system family protein [Isosphaeraceae bacterium]